MHGLALVIENTLTGRRQLQRRSPLWRVLGVLYTFHLVVAAFIFFRAESLDYALLYFESLFTSDLPTMLTTPFVLALVTFGIGIHFLPEDSAERSSAALSRMPATAQGALAALLLVAISAMGPDGVAPFIYFQF
jgi:hypothetical protein